MWMWMWIGTYKSKRNKTTIRHICVSRVLLEHLKIHCNEK